MAIKGSIKRLTYTLDKKLIEKIILDRTKAISLS